MDDHTRQLLNLLHDELNRVERELVGKVDLFESEVSFLDGRLELRAAIIHDEGAHPAVTHAHVVVELHRGPVVEFDACMVSTQSDRNAALAEIAKNWLTLVGAPIISLFHARPVLGAEHFAGTEPWGVAGRHGFTGPAVVREFGESADVDRLANLPLVAEAADLVPDGQIHMVKAVLSGDKGRGWRRELEIDGHATSHCDEDWKVDLPAPSAPVICTRFAVFLPTAESVLCRTPSEDDAKLDEAIERFVAVFQANPDADLDEAVQCLIQHGMGEQRAYEISSFVPSVCARYVLSQLGMRFADTYLRIAKDGTCQEGLPLDQEQVYNRSVALAPRLARSSRFSKGFRQLSLLSAEMNTANTLLHRGSKPENLVFGPSAIIEPGTDEAAVRNAMRMVEANAKRSVREVSQPRRWWQFWK